MKLCIVLSALGATLVSATVLSQAPAQQPSPPSAAPSSMSSAFNSLDTDKDGKISEAEAQASRVVAQSFSQADANHDGAISREEFSSAFTMSAPASPPPLPPSE
jgi:Ca2+-binding EF-hand superfamily protein